MRWLSLDHVDIQQHVPLAPFTTLRIGGPARYFAQATTLAEVRQALAFARERQQRVFILGGGSNLVVSDTGFDGLVLHAALTPSVTRSEETMLEVSAGTDWDAFVLEACTLGLSGVECLAGIPGLTGGTPVQNVGAYGQEVAETIAEVMALDLEAPEQPPRRFQQSECGFGYRRSRFNQEERGRWLVLAVRFRLSREAHGRLTYADLKPLAERGASPLEVYHFVRQVRAGKGMLIDPAVKPADARSAGSFFKNPVVKRDVLSRIAKLLELPAETIPHWPAGDDMVKLSAAWLIERAGFQKGYELGGAGISSRHTLALVNHSGQASCAELIALRDQIAAKVAQFGVRLEQEPVMLR